MQSAQYEKVRARAYALWQAEGMLEGRHLDHWCAAEREIASRGEQPPASMRKRKAKPKSHPLPIG